MDWLKALRGMVDFDHAKPVIVTYNLEAFFKIAQTGYACCFGATPDIVQLNSTSVKAV